MSLITAFLPPSIYQNIVDCVFAYLLGMSGFLDEYSALLSLRSCDE